ncbi:hypothetical protein OH77DRAFT_467646 [Trametes cingulata]|nr:hypothetical protein OH77DRAFT_467646 [Trametes cingulata]
MDSENSASRPPFEMGAYLDHLAERPSASPEPRLSCCRAAAGRHPQPSSPWQRTILPSSPPPSASLQGTPAARMEAEQCRAYAVELLIRGERPFECYRLLGLLKHPGWISAITTRVLLVVLSLLGTHDDVPRFSRYSCELGAVRGTFLQMEEANLKRLSQRIMKALSFRVATSSCCGQSVRKVL